MSAKQPPRSALSSIVEMRCPRCRTGKLFNTSTFSFKAPFTMGDNCPHCGQSYMPEPGFFYGAMFISYIVWGWFCVIFCLALIMGLGWGVTSTFALLILISAIFFIWLFRISRSIWFHIIVKYDPGKTKA